MRLVMLEELHVSGLGVVEDQTLELHPGLNVLTGETGAGKTMVAVALSLALGGRGSADLVRAGGSTLAVEARFSIPETPVILETDRHPAHDDVAVVETQREGGPDAGDDASAPDAWSEDGELILARAIRADGRSSARVGGRLVPLSTLSGVGAHLVEIHGQHQAEPLLRPATQLAFVDRYAGPDHLAELHRYRGTYAALQRAARRLAALEREDREREREKDLLQYQVGELESAAVRPGEIAMAQEEEARLANAERLRELASGAASALAGEGAATDAVAQASAQLVAAAGVDRSAGALADRASSLAAEAQDLAAEVRAYAESLASDPARLATAQERLRTLRALERKYGDGEEGILAYLEAARERLLHLEGAAGEREELRAALDRLAPEVQKMAASVSTGRDLARSRLETAILSELQEVGMPGARFEITLEPLPEPGPDGTERVEFRFAGGERQPLLPFAKVASGGELSRTMLACRSVLADLDDVPTLVFDEVDAGIGGRAAAAVGQRLARLAHGRQILVVTHLAQIAAHADRHFRVTKDAGTTRIDALSDDERSEELARMLSGSVSDVSLAHAREILATSEAVAPQDGAGAAKGASTRSRRPAKAARSSG
jgi:DNA repair protein RecN (Recombination protein N)